MFFALSWEWDSCSLVTVNGLCVIGFVNMAETMTHVVGSAPPNLEDKMYKMYNCEGKRDFPVMKECSGTQTVQLNGKRSASPDVENKENHTNGEVSSVTELQPINFTDYDWQVFDWKGLGYQLVLFFLVCQVNTSGGTEGSESWSCLGFSLQ